MKKAFMLFIFTALVLTSLGASMLVALSVSPALYVKVFDNEETRKLYHAYVIANKKVKISSLMNYAKLNRIEYEIYKTDNIITLHSGNGGRGETVTVWVMKGMTVSARFDHIL